MLGEGILIPHIQPSTKRLFLHVASQLQLEKDNLIFLSKLGTDIELSEDGNDFIITTETGFINIPSKYGKRYLMLKEMQSEIN